MISLCFGSGMLKYSARSLLESKIERAIPNLLSSITVSTSFSASYRLLTLRVASGMTNRKKYYIRYYLLHSKNSSTQIINGNPSSECNKKTLRTCCEVMQHPKIKTAITKHSSVVKTKFTTTHTDLNIK